MSRAQAFQIFRSCAASVSARPSANALSQQSRRVMAMGARYYSEDKSKADEKKKEDWKDIEEKDQVDVTPEHELVAKLKAKEAEVSDLKHRLQYLQADFINLQRNAAREKEQARDFAITRFASELLETVDVLALALKSVPPSHLEPDSSSSSSSAPSESSSSTTPSFQDCTEKSHQQYLQELHTGVEATHRLLLSTLFKHHIKPFDPTGDKFDPNKHEALYQAPVPGKEPGSVIDCQKVGYTIKDRVLRAAQVGVAQDVS
ncbi:hypothetical protein JAAARDRAFT_31805 [Jaapia argillacea MUCL 33604]|uniref:GrpE protein homolog, mitochondrial n=1 Tax=Jaapia argillacea MUCL 33604 TaxID=933084 RepID=A0A067QE01_9AGAM|nr:hypothetical protein JAAARDRAFT_31805 [Jaapia argillacea MUCL 33604]